MKRIIAFVLLAILISQCPYTFAADDTYTMVLDIQFDRVEIDDGLNIIKATDESGMQALYNYDGKKISQSYDFIGEFDDILALAKRDGKYYIINYQGNVVGQFDKRVVSFSEGIVCLDLSDITDDRPISYYEGKFALCRPDGTEIAQLDYANHTARNVSGIMAFYKGLMLTFAEGKVGAIDTGGNTVIPAVYDELRIDGAGELIIAAKDGKFGLLNRYGENYTEFEYDYIRELPAEETTFYVTVKNGLYGLLSEWGSVITPPQLEFEPERVFPDCALLQMSVPNTREDSDEYGVLYGLTNYSGKVIIPATHTQIVGVFQGIVAAAKAYDKGGYYTAEGAELTEFRYRMLSGYRGGYAFASACNADGSWEHHVLNLSGEIVFETENYASGYFGGLACINNKKLIDAAGDTIVDFTNSDMRIVPNYYWQYNRDGMYVIQTGEKYGVIRCVLPQSEPVWDFEYVDFGNVKSVEKLAGGYSFVLDDGTKKYLDLEGNPTDEATVYGAVPDVSFLKELELKYDRAHMFGDMGYCVLSGGRWMLLDANGSVTKVYDKGIPYLYEGCTDYIVVEYDGGYTITDRQHTVLTELRDCAIYTIPCPGAIITYAANDTMELIDIAGNVIVSGAQHIEYIGEDVFCVNYGWDTQLVRSDGRVIAANVEHYTRVGDNGYIGISTPQFEGYINTDGRNVLTLPEGYYVQGAFSEGLAAVVQDIVYSRYGKVSYINELGEVALQPGDSRWVYGGEFENGLAVVGTHLGKGGPEGSMLVRCVYDTPSDWAADMVAQAKDAGILTDELAVGYRKSITRERFCELVYQLPVIAQHNPAQSDVVYSDTDNPKIKHLTALGIINGVGNGRFEPDSYLTREQAATILNRIYSLYGEETTVESEKFADDADISDWARVGVYNMKNAGIMNGVGDNSFAPKGTYTTEQAVATIMRIYK